MDTSQWTPTGDTRITLAPPPVPLRLVAGASYLLVADFSAAGRFADEACRTALRLSAALAVVERNENLCGPGRQSWTVWTAPFQTYGLAPLAAAQDQDGAPTPAAQEGGVADTAQYDIGPHPYGHDINGHPYGYGFGGPYPYGHDARYGLVLSVDVTASVKNEGWTGSTTEAVPTQWSVQRIA